MLSGGRRAAAADAQPGRGAAAGRGLAWPGSSEQETAALLYQFLQAQYTRLLQQDPQTPAYSVLCQGQGDAASFAAVYPSALPAGGAQLYAGRGRE